MDISDRFGPRGGEASTEVLIGIRPNSDRLWVGRMPSDSSVGGWSVVLPWEGKGEGGEREGELEGAGARGRRGRGERKVTELTRGMGSGVLKMTGLNSQERKERIWE